mmetsp:Transcript_117465/g.332364  ORF Transcript_117465/g.332364 Transcript_117465/m.332364 type:complete len:397 (+) Transcript_117465:77-1267(+)
MGGRLCCHCYGECFPTASCCGRAPVRKHEACDLAASGFKDTVFFDVAMASLRACRHNRYVYWGPWLHFALKSLANGSWRTAQRSLANGAYRIAGENHQRPVFKHVARELFVYYWDDRDGKMWEGWWLGPNVGGAMVWSFNTDHAPLPPARGWRVPWNGPVNEVVCFELSQSAASAHGAIVQDAQAAAAQPLLNPPSPLAEGAPALAEFFDDDLGVSCSVCFEALWNSNPSVFVSNGQRLCCHAFCRNCAETLSRKQHGGMLFHWAVSVSCPLCRAPGVALIEALPDVRANARHWFVLCDADGDGALSKRELAHGLACVLPVSPDRLLEAFDGGLWDVWRHGGTASGKKGIGIFLADFLREGPGSVRAWIAQGMRHAEACGHLRSRGSRQSGRVVTS